MNNDELKQCCKDCEERHYKCHSECVNYKTFRLELDLHNKANLIEKKMNAQHYDIRHGRRDDKLQRAGHYKPSNGFKK